MAVDQNFLKAKIPLLELSINRKDQVKFNQLTKKKSFDQMPNLTETFDHLKRSSEIRSSDHSPYLIKLFMLLDGLKRVLLLFMT